MKTSALSLQDRVRGCLVGLAVGDALGVPVETDTHVQIMEKTAGRGVTGYMPTRRIQHGQQVDQLPGSWSDDTQLTLVTLRSLIRSGGFDLRDQAMCLVDAYESSTFGWGGTTRDAAIALKAWRDSGGKEGRAPEMQTPEPAPGVKRGTGSGVAMRIAPLSIFSLWGSDTDAEGFVADAMALGLLTHSDPRASIAAITLGHAIADFSLVTERRRARVRTFDLYEQTKEVEERYRFFRPKSPRFSIRLQQALTLQDDPERLREEINTGFSALESVPFAIATAARHVNDFRGGVLEGVNAGQDADTVGSMVGAMLGARAGLSGIPKEWVEGLRGADEVIAAADELHDVTFG